MTPKSNITIKPCTIQLKDKCIHYGTEKEAVEKMPEILNYERWEHSTSVSYFSPEWLAWVKGMETYWKQWKPEQGLDNMPIAIQYKHKNANS